MLGSSWGSGRPGKTLLVPFWLGRKTHFVEIAAAVDRVLFSQKKKESENSRVRIRRWRDIPAVRGSKITMKERGKTRSDQSQ